MNLIIDNGGTKAIWVLADNQAVLEQFTTTGIYPLLSDDDAIQAYIQEGNQQHQSSIDQVYFYSTGCRPAEQKMRLTHLLEDSFSATGRVEVQTDVLAAARALCGHEPGIACIMGTGSNSCLYDGSQIVSNRGGYGFILGDEGSGAVLGKILLQHYSNQTLPEHLIEALNQAYQLKVEDVIMQVYTKDKPNKYLAKFGPFLHEHRKDPFIAKLIQEQFTEFFEKCVIVYSDHKKLPIHFLGSIAHYFQEELRQTANKFGLTIKTIIKDPMPGLVRYHATS